MNNPAASCEVSDLGDEIFLNGVTPEYFDRGSAVLTIVRPRGSRRATLSHVEWVGSPVPNPPAIDEAKSLAKITKPISQSDVVDYSFLRAAVKK